MTPPPETEALRKFAHRVFAGADLVRVGEMLNLAPETLLNVVAKSEAIRPPYFADTLDVVEVGEALDAKFRLDGLDK